MLQVENIETGDFAHALAVFAVVLHNLLITNDLFKGMEVIEGKITLSDLPGIGLIKL